MAREARFTVAALVLLAIIWFCGLELRGLFSPDEGRYADIAREMLQSGDWVTPRLNGLKYFEKPPLQYWATAVAFALFGADEWTARLWNALTGLLGIVFSAYAAARLAPRVRPAYTALMFAGCWGYFLGAQFLTLDMGLTFFLSAAMLAFLLGVQAGAASSAERGWMLVAWAAMALAVLSKGLVGVVLPALALLAYLCIEGGWRLLRRLHWIPGLALFAAIACPWFLAAQERNPEFFRFFFVHEHFERFLLADHHRPGPWWYFLPVLALGLLPWTFALPRAVMRGWTAPPVAGGFKVDRFLIVWSVVITVFFSVSRSKLPGYVLPVFPALLLLMARNAPAPGSREPSVAAGLVAGAAAVALAAALPLARAPVDYFPWLVAAGATLCLAACAALLRSRASAAAIPLIGLGSLLAVQIALSGTHVLDADYSSERLIERVAGESKQFPPEPPFYSVATYDHSVPFYLGRPVTLVANKDELGPGIAVEPAKYVASVDEFVARWRGHAEAFAIMAPGLYEKLRREGLPGRVVARDGRSVVIARR